jgi:hypothetical protein
MVFYRPLDEDLWPTMKLSEMLLERFPGEPIAPGALKVE